MRHVLSFILLLLLVSACKRSESLPPAPAPAVHPVPALPMAATTTDAEDPILATVNGQAVTMADVRMALRLKSPTDDVPEEQIEPLLDGLIRQELVAQSAAQLGLEKDAHYQTDLAIASAPLNAFRRRALGDAYFHAQAAKLPPVTDAEAQKFFEDNRETLASEVRVEQFLTRDLAAAEAAHKEILAGKSIGDIARAAHPGLPVTEKPWELAWQPWQLVPEQWRAPLAKMKPGETSGVISGPKNRYWIIKLLERRPSQTMDFAQARAGIIERLTAERTEATREHMADPLIGAAKIVRHKHVAKAKVDLEP